MKKIIDKTKLAIKAAYEKDYIKIISVFIFFVLCYGLIYFSVDRLVSLDDHLFYIRFAEIIKERGLGVINNFHWIYFSNISRDSHPVYYSFLFYFVLIPFTYIKPLILAIKLYGVIFISLSFTILYYFFLKIGIKKPFLWTLVPLAIISYGSLSRFLLARPYTFAPALLILELYFLYKKKNWGIFLISLFYFYWHNTTFGLTLLVPLVFVIFENFYGKKFDLKPILVSLAAIIIDLIIAFSFIPGLFYIFSMVFGLYNDTIIGKTVNIVEGGEHYPFDFFNYINFNIPILFLFIVAVIIEIYLYIQSKRMQKKDEFLQAFSGDRQPLKSTLFALSLIFFLGNFITQRFNDYFIFFSITYVAMSYNEIIDFIELKKEVIKRAIKTAIIVFIVYFFVGNLLQIQSLLTRQQPYNAIQGAAEWLKNNTEEKEIVFNPTWDWFPNLFYYNSHNYYIAGLEPRFFYDHNHELYWAWRNISEKGFVCEKEQCDTIWNEQQSAFAKDDSRKKWFDDQGNAIASYIKNNFHSRYIITHNNFTAFNMIMENNTNFEKVFIDVYHGYYVFKIK